MRVHLSSSALCTLENYPSKIMTTSTIQIKHSSVRWENLQELIGYSHPCPLPGLIYSKQKKKKKMAKYVH